jgi:general secretion pathway protein D
MTRSLALVAAIGVIYATAFSAAAQGQTPTAPTRRPSPSSTAGRNWGTVSTGGDESGAGTSTRLDRGRGSTTGTTTSIEGTSGPVRPASRARGSAATSASTGTAASGTASGTAGDTPSTGAAERASGDSGAGREAPAARGAGGAQVRSVGGGSSGGASGGSGGGDGGGASFGKGGVSSISSSGSGAFQPVMEREVEYGPIPEDGEQITLEGPMPLDEFLSAINLATNWNMVISPELKETQLRFWLYEVSPKQALEVLKFNKVYFEFDEETEFLRVMTKEEYLEREFGKSKPHEFRVVHADIAYMESLVHSLLSPNGRIITDQRTNNIYVWDTQDNIVEMERLVKEMDVPLQKADYTIQHADLADIEAAVGTLLSQSGSLLTDVRTNQLFIWDNVTVLAQIKETISRLDTPVESQTFYITHVNAEDVLDSVESLLSERGTIQMDPRFNTLVVTDLPPRMEKIASLVETLDQKLETRTWILKYADPDFIADQIETYIPGEMGQIVLQDEVHQITATGLPSRLEEIDSLIQVWDIRRKQVMIEAYIVEVSSEIERAFSVNWSYFANVGGAPFSLHSGTGGETGASATGEGQIASGGRQPFAIPRYGALELDSSGRITRPILRDISGQPILDSYRGGNLAATLDYLDSQQKATILSSPKVTVQDGEEALFENATKVPYVSSSGGYGYGGYGYGYSSGSSSDNLDYYRRMSSANSRVEFIDVGTILTVLPRVTEDANILLDISAEDSTFTDKKIVVDDLSRTVPEKTVRRADTQVRVNSGDTIVLGGLRRDRASNSSTRTPLLGDLPLVGKLFRNPKRASSNSALLIFMTTTIVGEDTMPEALSIVKADEEIAKTARTMKKDAFGRFKDHLTDGKNEIGVAIGQNGQIHCAGEIVTPDDLRDKFFDAPGNMPVTVVIRKHPSAPIDVVNEVTEAAMEAGLRIEFDNDIPPIVPALNN